MDSQSEIDSGSLAAVKNLRSKFEQLAQNDVSPPSLKVRPASSIGLLSAEPSSPRPRAASNSYNNVSASEPPSLRPSSSSSDLKRESITPDLKAAIKRPPPPPPPARGSKPPPSPSASPFNRPVPAPHTTRPPHPPPLITSHQVVAPEIQIESEPASATPSVASLRDRFANIPLSGPSNKASIGASIGALHPAAYSETSLPNFNKPAVPPRPFHSVRSSGPEDISDSTSSLRSPFSDDDNSDTESSVSIITAPPAIPPRKPTMNLHNRTGSSESSESDNPPPTARPGIVPPPRPPPRYRTSMIQQPVPVHADSPSSPAPPLPIRRNTAILSEPPPQVATPPRLPVRPQLSIPAYIPPPEEPPSLLNSGDRKTFGTSKLPPPPTRTIGLGDKLPPARRPITPPSSDEESGEEDDPKTRAGDSLPDSSRSSRRPPVLFHHQRETEVKIPVPAFTGHAAVAGTSVVVATQHHVKIYDLSISDVAVFNVDIKDVGLKDVKMTTVEFRASEDKSDLGAFVWFGTKEGHLFEMDVRTGEISGTKLAVHSRPISHMFRHGNSMVTLDESGKAYIFTPAVLQTTPRVFRIAEKQEFAKIVGGRLFTAARVDSHAPGNVTKTPTIRVYDIFTPGSVGRSLLPSEHVGPVTSATIIPSQPDTVYIGHEEGYITVWALEGDNGYPKCLEVMRVSNSDVLCLEGVNNRLWAGGRNGMISAYDVSLKPWAVTNAWMAHPDLSVLRLGVDHYGIEKTGRLCVFSVGRDEQLKLWDGLLGSDWIDLELSKRETSFSIFRDMSILLVSWNLDASRPDSLTGDAENIDVLDNMLKSVPCPDIISFGFQEIIDLESRKMVAKNVILGRKKLPEDGGLSDKVTGAYKRWYERLVHAVRMAMPPDVPYSVVHTESLVGLFSCIFVKNTERISLKDVAIATIKRGMGGRYGNKGGIVARFVVEDSSICLINCHLAAGQHAVRQRNADVAAILEAKAVFPVTEEPIAYVGGGDGTMVLDHEVTFVNGDMNYRIDQRREAIIAAVRAGEYESLLGHDQLLKEIKFNRGCRFRGFSEGPLTFAPTYKYDPRTSEYDTSEKQRSPAWCDRVLWRARIPSRVNLLHYQRYEANVSDHRPISAAFTVTIKSIRHEIRQKVKQEMQIMWSQEEQRLLAASRDFYLSQALL